MRIDQAKALQVLEMLLEGVSIRSTVRITGVAKGTILGLLETVGRRAMYYWNDRHAEPAGQQRASGRDVGLRLLPRKRRACGSSLAPAAATPTPYWQSSGQQADSRLAPWPAGRNAIPILFAEKLRIATAGRFQLTTDGFSPTPPSFPQRSAGISTSPNCQAVRQVAGRKARPATSPADIIGIRRPQCGASPDPGPGLHFPRRAEQSVDPHGRPPHDPVDQRLQQEVGEPRSPLGYLVPLLQLLPAAHDAIQGQRARGKATTPAMAAGLTDHVWSLAELLTQLATHC